MEKDSNIPERWHGAHHYSNRLHIFFVFFLVFAALTFFWFYLEMNKIEEAASKAKASPTPTPSVTQIPTQAAGKPQAPGVGVGGGVACTMDAKVCPDGVNFVGRSGPNCEFQACPGQHCGGFIKDAKTCLSGYHCQLNSKIPDLGGTCVKD